MKFDDRTTATILVALRFFQQAGDPEAFPDHFADVAPLDDYEIDQLCEQINCSDDPHTSLAIAIEGGLVSAVVYGGDRPELDAIYVIDYDTEGADEIDLIDVVQPDGSVSQACAHGCGLEKAGIDLDALEIEFDKRDERYRQREEEERRASLAKRGIEITK